MKIKALWQSIMDNIVWQKKFHGWLTVFWFAFTIPAYTTGLLSSVTFVSLLSLYALAIGHFSSWQAVRVEVRQEEIEASRDTAIVERIEDKTHEIDKKVDKVTDEIVGEVKKNGH